MTVDDNTVDYLANLAKLQFSGEDKAAIRKDLENVLSLVEKLQEVDTEGVEPLIHMTVEQNELREDQAVDELTQEEALSNAPQKDSDYIKVPKFLRQEK